MFFSSSISYLVGTSVAAAVPAQDPAVVAAQTFTVEALWGSRVVMTVRRDEIWGSREDGLTILGDGQDKLSAIIRGRTEAAPGVGTEVGAFFDLAATVPSFLDDSTTWFFERETQVRDVRHFDGVTLNVIRPKAEAQVDFVTCSGPGFSLEGPMGHNPITWRDTEGDTDTYGLYDQMMAPFPLATPPEGTWLSEGPWLSELGVESLTGNRRVALRSVAPGSPEDVLGEHLYLFEEIAGTTVPVLSYVHADRETDLYSWCVYEYGTIDGPGGSVIPFPENIVEFQVNGPHFSSKRTAVRYAGTSAGLDSVKFPAHDGAVLWPDPGVLQSGEASGFQSADPTTWPARIAAFLRND